MSNFTLYRMPRNNPFVSEEQKAQAVNNFAEMIQRMRVRNQNRSRWTRIFTRITSRITDVDNYFSLNICLPSKSLKI